MTVDPFSSLPLRSLGKLSPGLPQPVVPKGSLVANPWSSWILLSVTTIVSPPFFSSSLRYATMPHLAFITVNLVNSTMRYPYLSIFEGKKLVSLKISLVLYPSKRGSVAPVNVQYALLSISSPDLILRHFLSPYQFILFYAFAFVTWP